MKAIISTILAAMAAVSASAGVTVTKPVNPGCPTAFAIVTDDTTYRKTEGAMLRYRDALEADGLSTYIVSGDWSSPDNVREELKSLYASEPRLEGIVLIGDIPVAMVRNAQHMTTAFKMDEDNYPILDSSVPSDRFYDCLDLDFRFMQQDSVNPHLFYYQLTEDCPQRLSPTFYSARIRYPEERGGDKYEAIARFLDKATKAKGDMKGDKLDRVVSFNGHGYNTDCLIAWIDEEKAYRENFPEAFKTATGFKHWNFRMANPMKERIFKELERPGIDLFMFHEHGGPTTQYINGYGEADTPEQRLQYLKSGIYSMARRAIKRGKTRDEVFGAFAKEYNLTPDFFNDYENPDFLAADSARYASKDIQASEFHDRVTMPRMVMFDACYNGSFHESDYIAGEYIFNPGETVVTQGNTRNVLQDRWTIEMIGLLSHGVRAGQYNKLVATLEGHLIGDPTMHFEPLVANTLSADMTTRKNDSAYWYAQLESPYADVRSIALRMLADIEPPATLSPRLLDIYKHNDFNTTRMEALMMLARYRNADFKAALQLALNDPYERIARMAADMAGKTGDPNLLESIVTAYIENPERQRVNYTLGNAMTLFPREDVIGCIDRYYADNTRYNGESEKEAITKGLESSFRFAKDRMERMADKSLDDAKRISAIRFVRNYPYTYSVDLFKSIITDSENSEAVRVNMAEALGWFRYSDQRPAIIEFCGTLAADSSIPQTLGAELLQTVNRLK